MDKVKIEPGVDEQKDDLFDPIPDFVDVCPCIVDLQPRWDPNHKDTDIDAKNDNKRPDLKPFCILPINHEYSDSVDDDLYEGLYLYTPKKDYTVSYSHGPAIG